MRDISKCSNKKCTKKEQCERYTSVADEYQVYAEFNEEDCKYFIKTNELEKIPTINFTHR